MERNSYKYGFTLVELSIVLVIIGLIVGAVVGGRSLIKAAELRKVVSEVNGYKTAINAFQLQYDELPGDMPNASEYWTSCTDDGSNHCNGNGNGYINWNPSTAVGENYRVWQHLSLSSVISGNYVGIVGSFAVDPFAPKPGKHVPMSAVRGGGYTCSYDANRYGHVISFGGPDPTQSVQSNALRNGIIAPEEARSIDLKMDDGNPRAGEVQAGAGAASTSNCLAPPTYTSLDLTVKDHSCQVHFMLDHKKR